MIFPKNNKLSRISLQSNSVMDKVISRWPLEYEFLENLFYKTTGLESDVQYEL